MLSLPTHSRALQPSPSGQLSLEGVLTQGWQAEMEGVQIWLDGAYPEVGIARWRELFQRAPTRLRSPLRQLLISSHTQPDRSAEAHFREGRIIVWGRAEQTWSQRDFEHELAHLHARDCGPPPSIREAWMEAMREDARQPLRLLTLQPWLDTGRTNQLALPPGGVYLSYYAAETQSVAEDWAEAVAYYCLDRREGELGVSQKLKALPAWKRAWKQPVYLEGRVRFSQRYPARAELLARWFQQEDRPVNDPYTLE